MLPRLPRTIFGVWPAHVLSLLVQLLILRRTALQESIVLRFRIVVWRTLFFHIILFTCQQLVFDLRRWRLFRIGIFTVFVIDFNWKVLNGWVSMYLWLAILETIDFEKTRVIILVELVKCIFELMLRLLPGIVLSLTLSSVGSLGMPTLGNADRADVEVHVEHVNWLFHIVVWGPVVFRYYLVILLLVQYLLIWFFLFEYLFCFLF